MFKIVLGSFLIACSLNAGLLGAAVDIAKNKAKDKAKTVAVDVYKARKDIRRENESITGQKSLLSKTEDKVDVAKNKARKVKETAIETSKNAVGKEHIETINRAKSQMRDSLIGKPLVER